jgi:hypothetical protein
MTGRSNARTVRVLTARPLSLAAVVAAWPVTAAASGPGLGVLVDARTSLARVG